ncbi:MAG TPA: hypothetical protein VG758_28105 [Hyphomicrobiaceae bacterium]|jgi:hypothetical protein|nr:hypothetical protein [Hyphomicrobiaceae bacterium]
MTRHILGVLGVIAAGVLLVVSMMMNYKFGSSLGKTETDAHIYGMASAAADCFKALAPFFFFAALRNRVWSQAVAAALVWVVVTGYAFTSALGHAALNRFDTSGQRVAASASYKDVRADLKRAEDQLKWIPPHRPPTTVEAELNVLKAQRAWMTSKECTDATLRSSREFCQQYFKLSAEYASGQESEKLRVKIAELGAQTAKATGAAVLGMADPQANVIARMTGLELETVQTSLMLFVALLIEIGSGFGMYVAFAYWRPHTPLHGPAQPASRTTQAAAARKEGETHVASRDETLPVGKPDPIWSSDPAASGANGETSASGPPAVRPLGDNDNKTTAKWIMPESDVELFYKQGVVEEDSVSIVSQDLYDGYKIWAKGKEKRPLNHSRFSEDFEKLGYKTVQVGGRQRYVGITLAPDLRAELEKKASFRRRRAQQTQEPAIEQPMPAVDEAAAAADQLRAAAGQMRTALGEPEATPDKAKAA